MSVRDELLKNGYRLVSNEGDIDFYIKMEEVTSKFTGKSNTKYQLCALHASTGANLSNASFFDWQAEALTETQRICGVCGKVMDCNDIVRDIKFSNPDWVDNGYRLFDCCNTYEFQIEELDQLPMVLWENKLSNY